MDWKTTGNETPDAKSLLVRYRLLVLDIIVTLEGDNIRIIRGHNIDYTTVACYRINLIYDSKYAYVINSL